MGFLLKMEDKRANDREADRQEMKEQREKERQEDKEEIVKVIDKCLGEKVLEAIEPFKEKTLAVEKAQCEMKEQVKVIMQEMTSLKEKLSGDVRLVTVTWQLLWLLLSPGDRQHLISRGGHSLAQEDLQVKWNIRS